MNARFNLRYSQSNGNILGPVKGKQIQYINFENNYWLSVGCQNISIISLPKLAQLPSCHIARKDKCSALMTQTAGIKSSLSKRFQTLNLWKAILEEILGSEQTHFMPKTNFSNISFNLVWISGIWLLPTCKWNFRFVWCRTWRWLSILCRVVSVCMQWKK